MQDLQSVIAAYSDRLRPSQTEYLAGAGGFSGARFWRLRTAAGTLCVRRWPAEHPAPAELATIHAVLRHVKDAGVQTVPVPMPTRNGASYVERSGFLWELTPWMPGQADYWRAPSRNKLIAALEALGHFHRATASFADNCATATVAPAIQSRGDLLNDLLSAGLQQMGSAIDARPDTEMTRIAKQIVVLFPRVAGQIESQLAVANRLAVTIRPCLRDIWHDHVLFTDDRVTGLIDFGAMKNDSVAADLSRLLGSLAGDNVGDWACGLAAYQRVCRLSPDEFQLIGILDSSTILLSGMNWLRWIYLENRTFEDKASVVNRLRNITRRLEGLVARSGRSILDLDDTNALPLRIMP
jgi:Ser/Thr protein kinase RdoA (MazF antagonist)